MRGRLHGGCVSTVTSVYRFRRWLVGVYRAYERRLRADGGDGSEAVYALANLLRELQAVLVSDNYTAITRLTEDR